MTARGVAWEGRLASGLLALLLAGCATTSPDAGRGPSAALQLTSSVDFKDLDDAKLADPYIAMRVQVCEAIGGNHCRALRMPVDSVYEVAPATTPGLIAFATLRGLGPAQTYPLGLTISAADGSAVWHEDWQARTPDDFAPRLELYQPRPIPLETIRKLAAGLYTVTLSGPGPGFTASTPLIATPPPLAAADPAGGLAIDGGP